VLTNVSVLLTSDLHNLWSYDSILAARISCTESKIPSVRQAGLRRLYSNSTLLIKPKGVENLGSRGEEYEAGSLLGCFA
jgi:hypothetical protein